MDEIPDVVSPDQVSIECDWCPTYGARWVLLLDAFLCRECFWQAPLFFRALPWPARVPPPTGEVDPWLGVGS